MQRLGYCAATTIWVSAVAACGSVRSNADANPTGSDANPTPFLSCAGMAATCGASGNGNCCDSLEVPGGSYDRSYDLAGDANSGTMSNPATVSSFQLDKYEVTVGRFRAFVNAGLGTQAHPPAPGAGAHAKIAGSGWVAAWNTSLVTNTAALTAALQCTTDQTHTWTEVPAGNELRPMNCLSWYEAMAFCAWDGGYLPTEAEWNYAAAGGDQQRAYPWSNPAGTLTLDSSHASYAVNSTDCVGDGMQGCAVTDLVPVGTKPAGDGRWGQSDLAGNVREWTLDGYDPTYMTPCVDCANLTATDSRGRRGGSFTVDATTLRTGARNNIRELDRFNGNGARCARAP
jgi:formylglycine-generating enzyme